ncbi:MAG: NAD(P)/FAD-dependent oxidoreductase [Thermodesulfobacteriota bacterium]|nr:NAD(P)/FAD-dependent oxidoreductase [Thermodesulfobacteriota bacterium]
MRTAPDLTFDVVTIGAGVVGLAVAQQLARRDRKLAILEKHDSFGKETSSRNSEVIHAGIYYPRDFLKSRLCVEGNRLLYAWCGKHNVPHTAIGKLIVATTAEQAGSLETIQSAAAQNGVPGLELLGKKQLLSLEPEVSAPAALLSPTTGIIDSHRLMQSLLFTAEDKGAVMSCRTKVTAIAFAGNRYDLEINNGEYRIRAKTVINSAGLHADQIAAGAGIDIDARGYRLNPCKGNYFGASPAPRLKRLVYPVPMKNNVGLGIHATLDLSGRVRFGPDSRYLDKEEILCLSGDQNGQDGPRKAALNLYHVDEDCKDAFGSAIRKYLPGFDTAALHPDMSGIRPKIQGPGDRVMDFIIREESNCGRPGFINLIGIESPGLTACLAIAGHIEDNFIKDGK